MNRPTPKSVKVFSSVVVISFILAQLLITTTWNGGPWCSPSLTAPHTEGHLYYQYTGYGFPLVFVTVVKEDCFQAQSTSYEWSLIGLAVDGLLLLLISAPLWLDLLKKKPHR